ncbi:MAG: asparagine synthase (glutamine-hydrolyzing) [Minisyncoccia bacterium]
MCGITGVIDQNLRDKEGLIRLMTKEITHRGPDDDGFYIDEFVGLGMRRLAIIDLETGKQPIVSLDGNLIIFFNGEIYNYKELKLELEQKGKVFKTKSDTEVILQMYETYGDSAVRRLRGMFAFCIYDKSKQTIFLARDFFGIKPLYYLKQNNKILNFGSEIKSLILHPEYKREVNDKAVFDYLSFQYNPNEETFFKNIYKLPPAHTLKIDLKSETNELKKYWHYTPESNGTLNRSDTSIKIKNTMEDSVSHHMIADVPVGSFLSGGIDSSIIATLMQKVRGDKKIKTFTVGFESLTEGEEAKDTSDYLETDHTEITIGQDEYFGVLDKAVWHFDEPVADPSAIGLYFVAREAKKHVKVVLSGEGSDELFGGYNIYLEPYARRWASWIPISILKTLTALPFNYFGKNYLNKASKKLSEWYRGNATIFTSNEAKALWKGKSQNTFSLESLYKEAEDLSESTQMQYIDIHTWLIGDILAKADKMTMANSLELRVPFLDRKVVDLARTLPDKFKWSEGETKYLLRDAFKSIIPESTRKRKKLGFPTPIRNWLTKDKKEIFERITNNEYIKSNLDLSQIEKIIMDHTDKKADNSRKIYLLLMLAIWYDVFIKHKTI